MTYKDMLELDRSHVIQEDPDITGTFCKVSCDSFSMGIFLKRLVDEFLPEKRNVGRILAQQWDVQF